jgi:hypothetical protein
MFFIPEFGIQNKNTTTCLGVILKCMNRHSDVRGSVHHSTILTEKPNKMQQCTKILLFLILNEAQHVSGDTTPIIRSLKLHKQSPVLHNTVEGCRMCSCWKWDNVRQHPTYAKPEAACTVLGS